MWNISNGERVETYAIAAEEPGEIGLNGAAARLVQTGDLIMVAAFVGSMLKRLVYTLPASYW